METQGTTKQAVYDWRSERFPRGLSRWLAPLAALVLTAAAAGVSVSPLHAQVQGPQRPGKMSPLELLQTAHALFQQKDYEAAREYYLEVLPSYPKNFDVLKNLAYCYFRRGKRGYAQAANYYARAYELNPGSRGVAENLSKCLMELNRAGEAATILQRIAERSGAPASAWKEAAEAHEQGGNLRQAEAAFDAYLQRNPGDLDGRTKLGNLFGERKDYSRALEQYRLVLSSNPNYPPAMVGMARVLAWQGQREQSMQLYDRVLRMRPDLGEAQSGKAFLLLWMDRYDEALTLLTRLRQRYPRDSEVARAYEQAQAAIRELEVAAARRAGDTARVESYYRERLARNPKDLNALKALAEATADPKRCTESIEYSRRALEVAPDDPSLELRLARSLALCQQYTEAVARYRRYLQAQPNSEGAMYELGTLLRHARSHEEAIAVYRNLLQLNPTHFDARLGLALALAGTRNYEEALLRYDEALQASPDNYDALQGKAYVLYWTDRHAEARAIFQSLAARRPSDPQNAEALESIAHVEEQARWTALRPAANAPHAQFLEYYQKRLAEYPNDRSAMKGLAYTQAQLKDYPAAIQSYRRVLELYPDDLGAKVDLARILGWEGQHDAAINLYREVLQVTPEDLDALESLARVYGWAGRHQESLQVYQGLATRNPSNTTYQLEIARAYLRLRDEAEARKVLTSLLATEPQNREARVQLARIELRQGNRDGALQHFEILLQQDPRDSTALLGKAQIAYYQGDHRTAHENATAVVVNDPNNFDAVFLLANIERARRNRRATLDLLDRAAQISPDNTEVRALQERIRQEPRITIRTSASYARELGAPTQFVLKDAVPESVRPVFEDVLGSLDRFEPRTGLPNQDLRLYTYGTTIGFSVLPRTNSYLSFSALPASSPAGPLRDDLGNQRPTGLTGAVAPQQFAYRQTTRFGRHFALRAGIGLIRFGPGLVQSLTGQRTGGLKAVVDVFGADVLADDIQTQLVPDRSAEFTPLGLTGITISPTRNFSIDVDVSRSAVAYTPTAARLGVTQNRFSGGLNFFFSPRSELHLEYFYGHYSSKPFVHYTLNNLDIIRLPGRCVDVPLSECFLATGTLTQETRAEHDQAHGGNVEFTQNLIESEPFSLDLGYDGTVYGFAGPRRDVFMGFFNPSFYQQHLLTPRIYGKLWGPVGYDIGGGLGLRQSGQGDAVLRAMKVRPTFTFEISRHFSLGIGYTYYNTAQGLGPLRGNAFRLTTEWKF